MILSTSKSIFCVSCWVIIRPSCEKVGFLWHHFARVTKTLTRYLVYYNPRLLFKEVFTREFSLYWLNASLICIGNLFTFLLIGREFCTLCSSVVQKLCLNAECKTEGSSIQTACFYSQLVVFTQNSRPLNVNFFDLALGGGRGLILNSMIDRLANGNSHWLYCLRKH